MSMQKEELLQLLHDPDVCREIFEIVRHGGKPVVQAKAPVPAASSEKTVAAKSKPAEKPSKDVHNKAYLDQDRIAALKDRVRNAIARKNGEQASDEDVATIPEQEPALEFPVAEPEGLAVEEPKTAISADSGNLSSKLQLLRNRVQQDGEKQDIPSGYQSTGSASQEKYTIVLERKCPVCEQETRVVKCKSRMVAETKDLDLCVHYKGINPYLYTVWTCEHCGFAAEESKFLAYMPNKTREKLKEFLESVDMTMEFKEERSAADAISLCEMAILYSELTDNSPNRQAGLHLKIAWICRYIGEKEKERRSMQRAAELYALSLETERYPVGKMSDNTALYLTGVLYFMLNQLDEATKHLSRIIGDQSLRVSAPKIYEKARDIWQDIKEMRKASKAVEDAKS